MHTSRSSGSLQRQDATKLWNYGRSVTVSCTNIQIHTHKHTHAIHDIHSQTHTNVHILLLLLLLHTHTHTHPCTHTTTRMNPQDALCSPLLFLSSPPLATVSLPSLTPLTSSENGPIAPKEPINFGRQGGGSFGMLISIWRRGSSLRGGAPLAISIAVIPKDHMSLKEGTLTFSVSYGVSGLTCEPDLLSYGISVNVFTTPARH